MPLDDRYRTMPFEPAIEFMRDKINLDTDSWRDVTDDEHDAAFVVAGAKGSVLSEFRVAVDRAIAEGQRPEDFRKEFDRIAEGWEFNGDAAWRSDIIYFTNLRASYGRGRDQMQFDPAVVAAQPYVQYQHSDAEHPRPLHLALDQQVFRKYQVPFALPNGYGCSCRYTSLSQRDLDRLGLEVSDLSRGDSIPVEIDGRTYNPVIEPAEGWDRLPNPNPQERREEILRRIADRSVPEVATYLRQFISDFNAENPIEQSGFPSLNREPAEEFEVSFAVGSNQVLLQGFREYEHSADFLGRQIEPLDLIIKVNDSFRVGTVANEADKLRIVMGLKRRMRDAAAVMPDGTLLFANPYDGDGMGDSRARVYQAAGFSAPNDDNEQWAIVVDGKLRPITVEQIEELWNG